MVSALAVDVARMLRDLDLENVEVIREASHDERRVGDQVVLRVGMVVLRVVLEPAMDDPGYIEKVDIASAHAPEEFHPAIDAEFGMGWIDAAGLVEAAKRSTRETLRALFAHSHELQTAMSAANWPDTRARIIQGKRMSFLAWRRRLYGHLEDG